MSLKIVFFFSAFLCFHVATAEAMNFSWVSVDGTTCGDACTKVIQADGNIEPETPEEFLKFVKNTGDLEGAKRVVFIHSPGGHLSAGMELGELFRRLQMVVIVGRPAPEELGAGQSKSVMARPGLCASACVYAFAGGVERRVPSPSQLGVHKAYRGADDYTESPSLNQQSIWSRDEVRKAQRAYLIHMGIDLGLIALEEKTSSSAMQPVSIKDLKRLKLITHW